MEISHEKKNNWKKDKTMKRKETYFPLPLLQELCRDKREWLSLCKIIEEEMASDGSAYQVLATTIPNQVEVLLTVTSDPAINSPARKDDLWICVFLEGDFNKGFLIQKITNMDQVLHPKAKEGETVVSSRPQKKINISNDHSAVLDEPALLGKTSSEWLVKLCEVIKSIAADLESLKLTYNAHTHAFAHVHTPPNAGISTGPAIPANTITPTSASIVTTTPEQGELDTLKSDNEQNKLKSDLVFIQEKKLTNSPPES